jgi:signal peptidase
MTAVGRAAAALLMTAAAALVALLAVQATGHRVLVVRSGSMAPAIDAGDAIVVRRVLAAAVEAGQVITFADPQRPGRLLTHRVQQVAREAGQVNVVTRGDANTGTERWSVAADGTVGVLRWRLPAAGRVLAFLGTPWVRAGLVVLAAVALASILLHRVWGGRRVP